MKKTLLRASLVAMLSFVTCGNDFMNVMASEEVSAGVISDPGAANKEAVKSIVAEMKNYIRSGHYRGAAKLMSNYVYAKGKSIEALFPSVLKDLKLGNPVGNDEKQHVRKLLGYLGDLSLGTDFEDIEPDELLAIATDNLNDYQTMANEKGYNFTQHRALAAALAGSVEVFKFMEANSLPGYDSDLFNAALVGGNEELVHLCILKGAKKTWSFDCFKGEGFIKYDLFEGLIRQGNELEKKVANRFLLTVSDSGRLDFVKHLVEKCHADVEAKNKNGYTPLIEASQQGDLDVVKYLVEQCHADVNVRDVYDTTPIHYASGNGHLDVVKYLHEQCHADVEAKAAIGNTPLIWASQNGYLDVVKYLVEQCHAKVEAKNDDGSTPLLFASADGHLDVVKYLVEECHADVEAKGDLGNTPLIWASGYGGLDIVKYLVEECHANVEAKDKTGKTPLIEASRLGRLDVVKYLVEECHANVEAKDKDGRTPLIIASRKGDLELFKYLYEECGAKITDKAINEEWHYKIKEYLEMKKAKQEAQK